MIIIYDTNTQKPISRPMPSYLVDGKEGRLDPHQKILNIINEPTPTYDESTHKMEVKWEVDGDNYVMKHIITEKSEDEKETHINNKVPPFLTKKQFFMQLFEDKNMKIEDVGTYIKNSNLTAKNKQRMEIELLYENEIEPDNLLYKNFLISIGMRAKEMRTFYINASKI
jgi:tRNA U34 5-carboxymethylaminomethyl modifying enzyme MnmG/GidA